VWDFDRAGFPDPGEMVKQLNAWGFTVLLWVVPYVSIDGPDYERSLRPLKGTDPESAKHLYLRVKRTKEYKNGCLQFQRRPGRAAQISDVEGSGRVC
jgi:hypothetical protein